MDCRHVQRRLSEYVDGELAAEEESRLLAHLRECPRCRAEEAALRRTAVLVNRWGDFTPPPGFLQSLETALRNEPLVARPAPCRRPPLFRPAFATALAGLLLLVGIGGLRNHPRPEAPARVAQAPAVTHAAKEAAALPRPAPPAPKLQKRAARVGIAARPLRRLQHDTPPRVARLRNTHAVPLARTAPQPRPILQRPRPVAPQAPQAEPLVVAENLYSRGEYHQAVGVLNEAFARSAQQCPEDMRDLYQERNSMADAAILECSHALHQDPGNVNARRILEKEYSTKVAILREMAG